MADHAVTNALTVDVEDYFQVSALAPYIRRTEWDKRECRIERNVDRILGILSDCQARATFFTLGWIAIRYPGLIRRIAESGHEIASHGYGHERVSDLTEQSFAADIERAKLVLEDIGGAAVRGYRAPSFSIALDNPWAFECIGRAGYHYSSSVYPIRHDHYGAPDAPRFSFYVRSNLLEVPIATARVMDRNLPAGGGGYFRLLPYAVSRWMVRRVNVVDRKPAIFYFHPWELDAAQPVVAGVSLKTRFRHYLNLHRTERRLRRLLSDFRWERLDRVILGGAAA